MGLAKELLAAGAATDPATTNGLTALMAAARSSQEVVTALLEAGADLEAKSKDGKTALSIACAAEKYDTVSILIKHGVGIDPTLFHELVQSGQQKLVVALLDGGVDMNALTVDARRASALLLAAQAGHLGIVKVLLERGADVRANKNGFKALLHASQFQLTEVAIMLLKHGVSPDPQLTPNEEAAATALAQMPVPTTKFGIHDSNGARLDGVRIFKKTGSNPDYSGAMAADGASQGTTTWTFRVHNMYSSPLIYIGMCMPQNFAPDEGPHNGPNKEGKNYYLKCDGLIRTGGKHLNDDQPKVRFKARDTVALEYNADEGRLAFSVNGASAGVIEVPKNALFHPFVTVDDIGDCVEFVSTVVAGRSTTPLISAARHSNTRLITALLDANADPNLPGLSDFTHGIPLAAAATASVEAVTLLLDANADINRRRPHDSATPLLCACEAKNHSIVELLMGRGADPTVCARPQAAGKSPANVIVPQCPSAGHPMVISPHADDIYRAGWVCNECGRHGGSGTERWFCPTCCDDFCFTCHPSVFEQEQQEEPAPASGADADWAVIVSGAGNDSFNGRYIRDKKKSGKPGYRRKGGTETIEQYGDSNKWFMCKDYGNDCFYKESQSQSMTVPTTGWEKASKGVEPAPTVKLVSATPKPAPLKDISPLLVASARGDAKLARILLEGAPSGTTWPQLEIANAEGATPLMTAVAQGGHLAVVQLLLDAGAKFDSQFADQKRKGTTALFEAILKKHFSVALLLLSKGADPNCAREEDGMRPIMLAARHLHTELVAALIAAGARAFEPAKNGSTALVEGAAGDAELVEILVNADGVDVNASTEDGLTALLVATLANRVGPSSCASVRLLLDKGADPNVVRSSDKMTCLYFAAKRGDVQLVRWLLEKGASTGVCATPGDVPPIVGAAGTTEEVVRTLLDSGADPNAKTATGVAALTEACSPRDGNAKIHAVHGLAIVKLLLERGADPNYAVWVPSLQPITGKVGVKPTPVESPLQKAIAAKDEELLSVLLEAGADANTVTTDKQGLFPLMMAAQLKCPGVAKILIEAGGATLDQVSAESGTTALHLACKGHDAETVKLLLEKGANPNVMEGSTTSTAPSTAVQCTPLSLACEDARDGGIVKLLIDHGVDDVGSGFYVAAAHGHLKTVKIICATVAEPMEDEDEPVPAAAAPAATAAPVVNDEPPADPDINPVVVDQLLNMGFLPNASMRAVKAIRSQRGGDRLGAEAAVEWYLMHMEDPDFNDPLPPYQPPVAAGDSNQELVTVGDDFEGVTVSGAGTSQFNGHYALDLMKSGRPGFKKIDGEETIEQHGSNKTWCKFFTPRPSYMSVPEVPPTPNLDQRSC